jgi:hypothetical protein
VLSHQAWTRIFAADPAALGRDIEVDGRRFVIVGVFRPQFTGIDDYPRDLWIPFSSYADVRPGLLGQRQPRHVEITARLRPGVTVAQAEASLTPFMARMPASNDAARDLRAEIRPNGTPNPLTFELLATLSPVFAAFALVLVTACANVSNVMLSRAFARHREIAVRLSLGASRGRIVRQLLTEGLLIAVVAGFAGLALAWWTLGAGIVALFSTLPPSFASLLRVAPLDFDYRVFLFALGVAVVTTLMFALLPALQASRLGLTDALRGQRTGTRRGSRLRSALVVAQVAVSLVLVVAALTLARNFSTMGTIDLGYQTQGVISVNIRGEETGLVPRLAAVLAADPRVAEVVVTGGNPMFIRSRTIAASAAPGVAAVRRDTPSCRRSISPSCGFRRGRGLSDERASARRRQRCHGGRVLPGADPIGKTIRSSALMTAGRRASGLHGRHGRRHHPERGQRPDGRRGGYEPHLSPDHRDRSARLAVPCAAARIERSVPTLCRRSRRAVFDPDVRGAAADEMREAQITAARRRGSGRRSARSPGR